MPLAQPPHGRGGRLAAARDLRSLKGPARPKAFGIASPVRLSPYQRAIADTISDPLIERNYMPGSFVAVADGHGGTLVSGTPDHPAHG